MEAFSCGSRAREHTKDAHVSFFTLCRLPCNSFGYRILIVDRDSKLIIPVDSTTALSYSIRIPIHGNCTEGSMTDQLPFKQVSLHIVPKLATCWWPWTEKGHTFTLFPFPSLSLSCVNGKYHCWKREMEEDFPVKKSEI